MSITTILQIYKRTNYLQEQIEAIQNQTIKSDKIIIVHNEGDVKFDYPENVELIYAKPNRKFHLRFAIGLLEQSEYLAFYDDDTIPRERWHENCIDTIEKHNCICGTNGRIVDRKNRKQYGAGWTSPSNNEIEVDFVGHSWFMKKETLKYMFYDDIIEYENGEDIQLSANAQIFASIPSFVPPHPANDKAMWGSNPLTGMKYGSDNVASYIVNRKHHQERYDLFDEYVKKGWKLLLEKNE